MFDEQSGQVNIGWQVGTWESSVLDLGKSRYTRVNSSPRLISQKGNRKRNIVCSEAKAVISSLPWWFYRTHVNYITVRSSRGQMSQWSSKGYTDFPQVTQLLSSIRWATHPKGTLTLSFSITQQVTFSLINSFSQSLPSNCPLKI